MVKIKDDDVFIFEEVEENRYRLRARVTTNEQLFLALSKITGHSMTFEKFPGDFFCKALLTGIPPGEVVPLDT